MAFLLRRIQGPRLEAGVLDDVLAYPVGQALVVASSSTRRTDLRRRLTEELTDPNPPLVHTLTGLGTLAGEDPDPRRRLGGVARLALLAQLVREVGWPQTADPAPPGLLREVAGLLDAIREARLDRAEDPGIPEGASTLLTAYRGALARLGAEDEPARQERLLGRLRATRPRGGLGPWRGGLLVVEDPAGFSPLGRAQLRALGRLAREVHWVVPSPPGAAVAFAYQEAVLERLVPDAPTELVEPADPPTPLQQHLFRAPAEPPPQAEATRHSSRDRAGEIRAVGRWARDLLQSGRVDGPWEIALVLPGGAAYADLVQEILPGMGLELELQRPGSLDTSEVGRTLVTLVEGAARGWPRRQLVQLLRAPWLDFSTDEHPAPDPDLLDQAGRSEGVLGGREDWLEALSHLVGRHRAAAPEGEDPRARARRMAMAQRVEQLRDTLTGVFDRLAPLEQVRDARDFARHVERLLGDLGAVPGLLGGHDPARAAEDVATLRAFLELLEELGQVAGLTGATLDLEQLEALVQAALPDVRPAPRTGGAGLVVCDARHAGAREWQAMALVGFAEGAYPAAPPRVPMLGGAPEARAAFRRLPAYADEPREALYRLLAACSGPLLVTRPLEESGVPLLPSPYWEDLDRAITWAPEPPALQDEAAWSPDPRKYQAQLAQGLAAFADDPGEAGREAAALALHDAEAGAVALRLRAEQARRRGDQVGRYLGFLEDPGLLTWVASEFGPDAVLPITLLEGFAQCPFRFFSRHLLGLEATEELREDVDAASRGLLVHDVLHRFMEPRQRGEVPLDEPEEAARERLAALLDEAFSDPRLRGFFWRHERRRLLGTPERPGLLDDWLAHEAKLDAKAPGRRPALLEWAFGSPTTPPLLIPAEAGPPVKLRGRVDRVDHVDAGYLIWDYKTGGVHRPIPKLRAFIQLQLPLYLLAVARRAELGGLPLGGAYLQLKGRGKVKTQGGFGRAEVLGKGGALPILEASKKPRSDSSWKLGADDEPTLEAWLARTERRVVELARRLGAGRYFAFRHPEAHRCVEYCDYRDVCRVEEAEAHHDFSPEVIPATPTDPGPEPEVEPERAWEPEPEFDFEPVPHWEPDS